MTMGVSVSQLEKMVFWDNDSDDGLTAETIDTRFGKVKLNRKNSIAFPRGLLGMPDKKSFFITNFPSEKLSKFKLLQCIDDHTLSFITLPAGLYNGIIAAEDLTLACSELGITPENLLVLLMVSVHRSPAKVSLSVNARAPLLIDSSLRLAAQYVFQTDKYKVQHYITT